jgi:hypothetical protein
MCTSPIVSSIRLCPIHSISCHGLTPTRTACVPKEWRSTCQPRSSIRARTDDHYITNKARRLDLAPFYVQRLRDIVTTRPSWSPMTSMMRSIFSYRRPSSRQLRKSASSNPNRTSSRCTRTSLRAAVYRSSRFWRRARCQRRCTCPTNRPRGCTSGTSCRTTRSQATSNRTRARRCVSRVGFRSAACSRCT